MGLLNRIKTDGLTGRSAGLLKRALVIRTSVEDEAASDIGGHKAIDTEKKKPLTWF